MSRSEVMAIWGGFYTLILCTRSDLETTLSVVGKRLDQLESVVGELSNALNRVETESATVTVTRPLLSTTSESQFP